ncbi:MAG: hypothetical protein FWC61_02045 [Proteobacteria bacterium]|nr:hypothetical protein [Pseudomonadota bacterium]
MYKETLKNYIDSDEWFVQLLEQMYGYVTSSSKGRFKIINTWAITQYITDAEIIEQMKVIKGRAPALADKAEKIIKDITKAEKVRGPGWDDDE